MQLNKAKFSVLGIVFCILFYGNFINIANYSFLSYSFNGFPVSNPIFEIIKYSRLPILLLSLLVFSIAVGKSINLKGYFIWNLDVILFCISIYLGLINSIDIFNGIFYSVWQSAALCTVLLFFFYLSKFDKTKRIVLFFQFLFWSNFIVLPLLLMNFKTLGQGWSYHMAYSDKTFYPYCLLSMMVSIFGSNLLANKSIFNRSNRNNRIFEIVLIVLIFFFCFLSSRRTPLFIMLMITPIYIYIIIGRKIWKKLGLVLIVLCATIISLPKIQTYIEKNKYELSILKKINDLQENGGDFSKDNSYNKRKLVWVTYLEIFNENLFVGVGSYNSGKVQIEKFKGSDLAGYSPHNLYLGLMVEHGIIGLMLFFFIAFKSVWILFKRFSYFFTIKYMFFFLLPVLIINWNEYNLIPGQVFYWTTILVILFPRIFLLKSR